MKHLVWIPLLIVLLWAGKNFYYFGSPGMSSWGSMSFFKMTTWQLPSDEILRLTKARTKQDQWGSTQGKPALSMFSTQPPFPSLWRFNIRGTVGDSLRTVHYPRTPSRIIHVLDTTEFAENGRNMNHWLYLYISKDIKADNKYVLNHYPKLFYFGAVPNAWRLCFKPSWSWFMNDSGSKSHRRASNFKVLEDMYRLWWVGIDWSVVMGYMVGFIGGVWLLKGDVI